jgi:hypothetical protein
VLRVKVQVKIPAVGESITEVMIGEWKKRDGEAVQKNEVLLVLESDKATVEVVSEKMHGHKMGQGEGCEVCVHRQALAAAKQKETSCTSP